MQILLLSSVLITLTQSWVASANPTGLLQKREPQLNPSTASFCDISKAQMPPASPALPPPSAGLILSHVAIGRGTQNYSCADSTSKSIPVQVGALASLFNATCVAGQYPQLLAMLPGIAYQFPIPDSTIAAANLFLSGHHYFTNTTTPFFNLDTDLHQWGTAGCAKINSSPAPNAAKDVAWLKLAAKDVTGCTISEVYRLNTVGGVAPATCQGQPATIQVQYAAEYWLWSGGPGGY